MHELVDEAELARLGRTLRLPGEDDVQCCAHADEAGEAVAPPRAGDDAELHLGKSQLGLRMISGHPPVTGEREFHPAAKAAPVNRRDDRLPAGLHPVHQFLRLATQRCGLLRGAKPGELLYVGTRDEVLRLAGDEHDRAHHRIALQPREEPVELLRHPGGKGVHRRACHVQGDHGGTGFDVNLEGGHAHGLSSTRALPMPPCAQMETSPNCTSRRRISLASVVTIRAPVAPNG